MTITDSAVTCSCGRSPRFWAGACVAVAAGRFTARSLAGHHRAEQALHGDMGTREALAASARACSCRTAHAAVVALRSTGANFEALGSPGKHA